jgi:hypothetical protein
VEVAASEFYQGVHFTALEPGEILTSISDPITRARPAAQLTAPLGRALGIRDRK